MSRTTNSQNALVNLLRPTVVYDSGVGFIPKLVLSNIDVLTANQIVTDNFQFGGVGGNVFIGSNVGGGTGNSNNVGIGVSALAGASSTTGTVAIGYGALQSATGVTDSVAIGSGTIGGGTSNVIVGANSGTTGARNVILGTGMNGGASSNKLYIGYGGVSNTTIGGDLQQRRVGIATSDPQTTLDVSGFAYIREYLGVGIYPPRSHVDVNGMIYATSGFRANRGSATQPAFSFIDDSGTGFYQISNGFAITNKGIEQVLIQDASFGIRGDLWVSGSVNISGSGTTNQTVQGYLRVPSSVNPTIDISGENIRVDGYVKAGGSLRTDGAIRVGTYESPTVDISGSTVSTAVLRGTTAVVTPAVRDATVPNLYDLSGGNLRLTSNVELSNGFVRAINGGLRVGPLLAPLTDISGGNIRTLGHLDVSSGSASQPSLGFVTDGSTGIHWGGTSILAFDTSGIQRMTLSNGNLGIGRLPEYALDVSSTNLTATCRINNPIGEASIRILTGSFSDASAMTIYQSTQEQGIYSSNSNPLYVYTDGSRRLAILSNGNIGIGTSTPTATLQVAGNIISSNTSNSIGGVVLDNGNVTSGNFTTTSGMSSNRIGGVILENSNVTSSNFTTSTASSNNIGGVVLSNTRVGIGISPVYALDVSSISSTGTCRIANTNGEANIRVLSGFFADASAMTIFQGSTEQGIHSSNSNPLYVYTGGSRRLAILSNGNVGIGTSNPSATLQVAGNIVSSNTSNSIGGVTLSNSNAIVGGFLRNALTPSQFDISDGNISNSGRVTTSNIIASGYLRNALTPTQFDISGGNISNSGTITAGTGSNTIGGVILSASNITAGTGSNTIGGVILSASNITAGTGSNRIGGVTLNASNITAGTGSNSIGSVILNNGYVSATAASASTPSYSFLTDSTMGMYSAGTNQLGFATAGTQKMVISNANVGIGTAAPTQALDVQGSFIQMRNPIGNTTVRLSPGGITDASGLQLSHNTLNQFGLFCAFSNGTMIFSNNSSPFVFLNAGVEHARLTAAGNLGIGTSAPTYRLDTLGGTGRIRTSTSNTFNSNTLIVQNDFLTSSNNTGSDYLAGNILLAAGTATQDSSGQFYGTRIGTVIPAGGFQDTVRMGFFTPRSGNDNTAAERMSILSGAAGGSGRVGINTTAPSYTLDVSGDARATNMYIGSGASPTLAMTRMYSQTGLTTSSGGVSVTASGSNTIASYTDATLSNGTYFISMTAKFTSFAMASGGGQGGGQFNFGAGFSANNRVFVSGLWMNSISNTTSTFNAPLSICGIISNTTGSTAIELVCQRYSGNNTGTVIGEINEIHLMKIA